MSVQPSGTDHHLHDELLIARLAGDDLSPSERAGAQALIETCAECAILLEDLRSIIADMAVLPAPRRSRDFRLTPADAARLRPQGLIARIPLLRSRSTSARRGFAGALGAAMATLGLAGMLVSGAISVLPQSAPTVLLGAGGAAPSAAESQAAAASIARPVPSPGVELTAPPQVLGVPAGSPAAGGTTAGPSASAAVLPAPNEASRNPEARASASGADTGSGTGAGNGTRDYAASPGGLSAAGAPTGGKGAAAAASPAETQPQPVPIVPLASLFLLVVGLGLLLLARFTGRRASV